MFGSSGGAVAIGPAHASVGAQFESAVAGGSFENVTTQIVQRLLAGANRLDVDHPPLFPDSAGQGAPGLRVVLFEGLIEEMAKVVAQGIDRQEEFFFGRDPLALFWTRGAAGHQVREER